MTTKFNLTINPLTVVLLIGFVICLVIIFRSCQYDPGAEIGRLQGEVEARDEQIEMKEQGLQELREKNEALQAEKDGAIDSANTVIANLEEKESGLKNKIGALEKDYTLLQTEAEQIDNLKEQVISWKGLYKAALDRIDEKNTIIFSLKEKYNKEHSLRLATEVVLDDAKKSIAVRDELILELERKLRHKARWQTLERLAFVGVAGLLLYNSLS